MRVAVVGAGVVGLSAAAALLERGAEVVCFEQTGRPMLERSAGSSRIFRLAHRTPELVALAADARAGFARWAERVGRPLLVPSGCVVSGADVAVWAAAMDAAGAPYETSVPADRLRLPVRRPPQDALLDPAGGVIDVDAVRALLEDLTRDVVVAERVTEVDAGGQVRTPSGSSRFDAVLLAAGVGTAGLADQVGVAVPDELEHHVRFTFAVDPPGPWHSWIDLPASGLGTYQHASGPGQWAVGAHQDPRATAWDVGRDVATDASRDAVLDYAREHLTVEPEIVEELYCTPVPGLGDGWQVQRSGRVVAVHGENLMKFAPLLGDLLSDACVSGEALRP
jgi:sarcosine oxidase